MQTSNLVLMFLPLAFVFAFIYPLIRQTARLGTNTEVNVSTILGGIVFVGLTILTSAPEQICWAATILTMANMVYHQYVIANYG